MVIKRFTGKRKNIYCKDYYIMSGDMILWKDSWGFSSRIFDEMDKEFSEAEDMLTRMFRTVRESGRTPQFSQRFPYYYGYQITVGPDGKPHIREFGNARPSLIEQTNVRQPLVDANLNEKENALVVTAEMPGITKQDVKVELEEGLITIHAEKGEKKYHTEVPINTELDADSAKASYTNGILELKIDLKEAPKPKVREVRME
jgi:HSP20 family protein